MRVKGIRSELGQGRRRSPGADPYAVNIDAIPFLAEPYRVHGVEEVVIIGDAPKNYVTCGGDTEPVAYIAKQPRVEGPIECVTEYMIARLGAELPLRVAKGRLVRLRTPGNENDVRYMSRYFLSRVRSEQLIHGSQIVAGCFEIQEKQLAEEIPKGRDWEFYTLELVAESLASLTGSGGDHLALYRAFARMITFDAIVGANDRHAQNWGVIKSAVHEGPIRFAPVFDTARGLLWNMSEETLERWDRSRTRSDEIARYAEKSRPLVGIAGASTRPNHFDLVAHMAANKLLRSDVVHVVEGLSLPGVAKTLHVEFRRLVSRRRLECIVDLLKYRHGKLRRVCGLV